VNNVNRAPVLDPIADITVNEGETVTFSPTANDPDGDTLTITYTGWMTSSSYTTNYADAGVHTVTVTVSDGALTDSQDVQVTVNNVNRAPVLAAIGDKAVNEGQLLEFTVSAADLDGDVLTYSASNLPTGSSFDPVTHVFSWIPANDQAGSYTGVRFEVTDGTLSDSEDITITVNDSIPNWDVNADNIVDILDLVEVGQHFEETFATPPYPRYDVNQDGTIDISDITIIGQRFGETTG
jgi:hypothetical protein